MLEKVKLMLRISHNYLDDDIQSTIDAARAEMVRAGVSDELANSDMSLVERAIKTYCQYVYASDVKLTDGYWVSWTYQLDNLRKATIDLNVDEEG